MKQPHIVSCKECSRIVRLTGDDETPFDLDDVVVTHVTRLEHHVTDPLGRTYLVERWAPTPPFVIVEVHDGDPVDVLGPYSELQRADDMIAIARAEMTRKGVTWSIHTLGPVVPE